MPARCRGRSGSQLCPDEPVATRAPNTWLIIIATVKYFLITAPVDWSHDQYIRRFLLQTGEYVSCVFWYVDAPLHFRPELWWRASWDITADGF